MWKEGLKFKDENFCREAMKDRIRRMGLEQTGGEGENKKIEND